MKDNKEIEKVEEVEKTRKEEKEMEEESKNNLVVSNINDIGNVTRSKTHTYTTITDQKMLFNLETNCDYKINDCVGETIRVKNVLIKSIITPLAEPVVNEESGEIIENDYKKVCILIDDNNKSYVTGSKMFTNQFIKYIQLCGIDSILTNGLDIKIIKRNVKNSSNQALAFELV